MEVPYIIEPAALAPNPHIGTLRIITFAISEPSFDLSRERLVGDLSLTVQYGLQLHRHVVLK